MNILFDHQIFSLQKYGGISRYFANLHNEVDASYEATSEIGMLFTDNTYITGQNFFSASLSNIVKDKAKRYKYNKWYCKYLVSQNKFDVFHPTFYNPYFLKFLKKPFVLTVHDMINERFPEYYKTDPAADYKKALIKHAGHIIAISEYTKNDILNFNDIDEAKISVIHHGYQMQDYHTNPESTITPLDDYLLYVGDRYAYKNFLIFIKAIAPIIIKHGMKLICAGGKKFNFEELESLKVHKISSDVLQADVTDQDLNNLYRNAAVFVYPSLYEGFGLPILEAFNNNCPVVLSNATAFPEVAGNAAQYFDPLNPDSIAFAVEKVLSDNQRRDELIALGKERLKLFSIDKCLQKTLAVYRNL